MSSRSDREPKWISKRSALAIHESLLAEHGGAAGLVSDHLLDSALHAPPNHYSYGRVSDLFELASVYAQALTQNHPFIDGNKRVALTLALTFLGRNGVDIDAPEAEAVEMVVGLAADDVDRGAFAEWLRRNAVSTTLRAKAKRGTPRVVKKKK